MMKFTALLASAFPRPLWSDMASLPNERGGLYMLQLLNFVIMMLNGLLGVAIAKVLEVAGRGCWCSDPAQLSDAS